MYRSTPVTYLASSLLLTGISGANVTRVPSELLHAIPPSPSPAPSISHPICRPQTRI
ncbi:hypothetical protein H4I95_10954 [Botrytis cinerea]